MPLLNSLEKQIWERALPLQDKRNDTGHAEVATYFALLLNEKVGRNRDIIIPSIILHDIGYDISPEGFREAFLTNSDKDVQLRIRLEHQVKGGVLAYNLLKEMQFPSDYLTHVLRINLDHDTRFYEPTPEGEVVQDADVLWRFTKPQIDAYLLGKSLEEIRAFSNKSLSKLHLSISKDIAEIELENSLVSL